ncbi:PREDICTED: interleukin-6 receptor subunit alpha, partial [Nanorana parkeri]|uniref:interleukin-6 receptor subunit alpha n=1 Tax=Nanorana parkeri TaxID=125878 RepID=UPI000854600C
YEEEDDYTCYRDGVPACTVQLLAKDDLEKPKISCYIRHPTYNITCEWQTTRKLRPHAKVTLIAWMVNSEHIRNSCSYLAATGKFTCSTPYKEGDSGRHTMSLCVIGRTDSQTSNIVDSTMEKLVQPDAPINVTVASLENRPYSLRVSWSPTMPWLNTFYKLDYQVQYHVEGAPHVSNLLQTSGCDQINVLTSAISGFNFLCTLSKTFLVKVKPCGGENEKQRIPRTPFLIAAIYDLRWGSGSFGTTESTFFVINDAFAGRRHVIRVRAKEEFFFTWSEWSAEVVGRPWSDTTEEEDQTKAPENPSAPIPRYVWLVTSAIFVFVLLLFLGLLMRNKEIKLLKLKGGLLRTLFQPSRRVPAVPQPLSGEPLLVVPCPPPDAVTVTVPEPCGAD